MCSGYNNDVYDGAPDDNVAGDNGGVYDGAPDDNVTGDNGDVYDGAPSVQRPPNVEGGRRGGEGGRQRWASIGDSGEWQRLWTNSRWSQYSTTHGQTSSGRTPASPLASRLTWVGRSCEGVVKMAKWGVMSWSELNEVLLSKGSESVGGEGE